MNPRAQIRMLPDRRRVHMQDGPIDLIVEAFGEAQEVECAYRSAAARFVTVLDESCGELALLRQAAHTGSPPPNGPVARRMWQAVLPYSPNSFITPMAAVAGAVAEEILSAMTSAGKLRRAYVNDGGDIALHLTPGETFVVGMMEYREKTAGPTSRKPRNAGHPLFGTTTIEFEEPIRGIATSGWRGRSFSLGIADAVTVLADTATMADAGATMIANAVDLPGHPAIARVRACDLDPDSDLGERLVTQAVGELSMEEIQEALAAGLRFANSLQQLGLIRAAAVNLKQEIRVTTAFRPSLIPSHSRTITTECTEVHGGNRGQKENMVHA
jgi:ApbE superfamily uncharacterized protein (UPF0280 family)